MLKYLVIALSALAMSACAIPEEHRTGTAANIAMLEAQPEYDLVERDGETLRCVNEPVLGSRMGRRICYTETEWLQIQRASRSYVDDVQRAPIGLPRQN